MKYYNTSHYYTYYFVFSYIDFDAITCKQVLYLYIFFEYLNKNPSY